MTPLELVEGSSFGSTQQSLIPSQSRDEITFGTSRLQCYSQSPNELTVREINRYRIDRYNRRKSNPSNISPYAYRMIMWSRVVADRGSFFRPMLHPSSSYFSLVTQYPLPYLFAPFFMIVHLICGLHDPHLTPIIQLSSTKAAANYIKASIDLGHFLFDIIAIIKEIHQFRENGRRKNKR